MKINFLTNIPTPYRVSMYNSLITHFSQESKTFRVYFFSKSEPDRDWAIPLSEMKFDYFFGNNFLIKLGGLYLRFSPSLIFSSIRGGSHLILSGGWNDPNVIFIVMLKRLHLISNKISFWTEANNLTNGARRTGKFKYTIRRFVLNTCDGYYLIPGHFSVHSLRLWGVKINESLNAVYLPNVPHSSFDVQSGTWRGSGKDNLVYLIVARLIEDLKGIKNFLTALGSSRISNCTINIVGAGVDRVMYEEYIANNGISNNVHLLGSKSVEDIVSLLQESDICVLPSFSDPSPLVLVEAVKIGVPLLVSNRCGNHYECVDSGFNGFTFDPDDHNSIRLAFDSISSGEISLTKFSQHSLLIADKYFNSNSIMTNLSKIL